jgi:hypothetical protein
MLKRNWNAYSSVNGGQIFDCERQRFTISTREGQSARLPKAAMEVNGFIVFFSRVCIKELIAILSTQPRQIAGSIVNINANDWERRLCQPAVNFLSLVESRNVVAIKQATLP